MKKNLVAKKIISVHMPKVAGTSFLHQLKMLYGEDQILLDYQDDPTSPLSLMSMDPYFYVVEPIKEIEPCRVVHGHFHPGKYDYLNDAFRMTFLRHPIDNVMSIYDFWSAHDKGFWEHPIFNYFKDSNLSRRRFAMIPQFRYLYTRTYFSDFNMKKFDFIGDYAKYNNELTRLGDSLGVSFDLNVRHNITSDCFEVSSIAKKDKRIITDDDYVQLEQILEDDIEFYETHKGR